MRTWIDDAREFGLHVKQGGWRLGLLVARNVNPSNGQGTRTDLVRSQGRVSAVAFAREAGLSNQTVSLYLEAWERAADVGHVPHAADLGPGAEPPIDADALPAWEGFYQSPVGRTVDEERRAALRAQAEADGVGPSKVIDIASNPKALAAAIKADVLTANAALQALQERTRSGHREPAVPRELSLSVVLSEITRVKQLLRRALNDAVRADLAGSSDTSITQILDEIIAVIGQFSNVIAGTSLEEVLAEINEKGA
jgi:hypothetical protein